MGWCRSSSCGDSLPIREIRLRDRSAIPGHPAQRLSHESFSMKVQLPISVLAGCRQPSAHAMGGRINVTAR